MEIINAFSDITLFLGKQNEHLARAVRWDLTDWVEVFGNGEIGILVYRPEDSFSIPVMPSRNGSVVEMPITNVLTAQHGNGVIELRMYRGDEIVKSETWNYRVEPAAGRITGEAPAPIEDYRDEIVRAGGKAARAADEAEQSAKDAARSLQDLRDGIASGEFKGDKGDQGIPGEKGDPFVYSDFTPEQLESLRGPQGIQGPAYVLTPADKTAITNAVLGSLPIYDGSVI